MPLYKERIEKDTPMAIYYITLLILTGTGFILTEKKRHAKKAAAYLAGCLFSLTLLSSLRYAIGFDYFSYRSIYDMASALTLPNLLAQYWYEPLFFAVCKAFCLAGLPYEALVAAISFFVLSVAMWFLFCYAKFPWIGVYLYITLQFFAYGMNLMRQAIAVSFFLLAYPYLEKRRPLPFAALIFAGGLFHNSLWIVSPLYFMLTKKHSFKFNLFLSLLALSAYFSFDLLFACIKPLLPLKYASYQDSYFWNASTAAYLLPPAIYAVLIYLYRCRIACPARRAIYENSALYNFLISIFITKHFILERFAVYPFILALAAIPGILASFRDADGVIREKRAYYCAMALFMAFGGAYFLFAASKGFHHVYPYISLFDKSVAVPTGG